MKAWELLEKKGWCQGAMRNCEGQICALQAMIEVYGYESVQQDRLRDSVHNYITDWNDAPDRTKAEVIAAMKAADV